MILFEHVGKGYMAMNNDYNHVMEITMDPSGWITLTNSKVQVKELRGAVKLRPFKVEQTSFVVFCNFCPSKFSSPFKML